ncbi:MAG: TnsA endonuclease N-terminal domain-containing protein [Methylovirgula sp.]|uniref:TnsA endonuclease N-terminal domain-containing protein n=1 Tax=Methylovirgula sp. TaxID=1978224 RepID=UPI00307670E8
MTDILSSTSWTPPYSTSWTPPSASTASRLPPVRSRGSSRGTVLNFKANRTLWYESSLERKTIYVSLTRPDVVNMWDQPPQVTYVDAEGNTRHHTFDFLVQMASGTRIAVAVKPSERAEHVTDILERIASQGAVTYADRVTLITERDLPKWRVWNAQFLHSAMCERADADDNVVREILADVIGDVKIGDIINRTDLGGRGLRAVARLLGAGELRLTLPGRINRRALVTKVSLHAETREAR